MSKRQFVSTIIILLLANLLVKAMFIFGIDIQVQQRVGLSSYGLYFTLLSLCYIFQIVNDFGLNLVHNTDTATHGHIRQERWLQILRIKVVLAVGYSALVVAVALVLGYMYAWKLLGWLILNNILVSLILILRAGISGSAGYKKEALISVMDKALMILFCGFLLIKYSSFRIEWFVWSQTASLVITAILAWLISTKFISKARSAVDNFQYGSIIRTALPFALMTFLMFIYSRSDSVMIEKLSPQSVQAVGVYAAGFRLLDAANMIAFLFGPLLIPMYVRLRHDRMETIQLMQLASGMMVFITGVVSISSFFWAPEIMMLCYGNADENWVTTFRLLILSHIPIGMMYVFGSYLTAMHQMKRLNILFACSVAINLILNFILIPMWGTIGAATSSLITQSITTLGLIALSHQFLKEKMNLYFIVRVLAFFMIITFIAWVFTFTSFPWYLEMIICGGIGVMAAFLLRLLQWSSFKQLLPLNPLKGTS